MTSLVMTEIVCHLIIPKSILNSQNPRFIYQRYERYEKRTNQPSFGGLQFNQPSGLKKEGIPLNYLSMDVIVTMLLPHNLALREIDMLTVNTGNGRGMKCDSCGLNFAIYNLMKDSIEDYSYQHQHQQSSFI